VALDDHRHHRLDCAMPPLWANAEERVMRAFHLCECGCGESTTNPRFIHGHNQRRSWSQSEVLQRFTNLCAPSGECLLFVGSHDKLGYGRFSFGGRTVLAHRFAYESVHGLVPEGLELDHLCRTPACVYVDHLEAVTHRENIRRGHRSWEFCPHGEQFRHRDRGQRDCKVCTNARRRVRRAANPEKYRQQLNEWRRKRREVA
jgi:hypothetical protein